MLDADITPESIVTSPAVFLDHVSSATAKIENLSAGLK
jgi:hypothetical protein